MSILSMRSPDRTRLKLSTRRTARLAVLALLIGGVLGNSGCAAQPGLRLWELSSGQIDTPRPSETESPAPTVDDIPIGGVLSKEVALKIRTPGEEPANGDSAYQMPDESWVKINPRNPLPKQVQQVEQARVDAIKPPSSGSDIGGGLDSAHAATNAASSSQYATGKPTIVISRQLGATLSGGYITWKALGSITDSIAQGNKRGAWSTSAEAKADVLKLLSSEPNASEYEVLVAGD